MESLLLATTGEEIALASAMLSLEKIRFICCKWENVPIFVVYVLHLFIGIEYKLEINFQTI